MFSRLSKSVWKSKDYHSLDHLKHLHGILQKNQTVSESNSNQLIETLRAISEILIWGDQNDSSVWDFFLEKNMLGFFIRYLQQKGGKFICIQLLQTLNILFENISNETSVYYLLSNNHVNCIITHKFDFSDEEVMAYYISFLKTLSLKLNGHTIHFFYNEHTNDFALYTEAIKFFNHSESMVRIAVRTITLNVYRVRDTSMLRYIRDKTASPYFSNLVFFISKHILELDSCVRHDADHKSRDYLADLVAEHLDHLHYLNDILCLEISSLNHVLTQQLLEKLLLPLYIKSLSRDGGSENVDESKPRVSVVVSLFLLSQLFLIVQYPPLIRRMACVLFSNGDLHALDLTPEAEPNTPTNDDSDPVEQTAPCENTTDEEKLAFSSSYGPSNFFLHDRPFLATVFGALECRSSDYEALYALCLLYALGHNKGMNQDLLDSVFLPSDQSKSKKHYNVTLVELLIRIVTLSCQNNSRVRLCTLELSLLVLRQLVLMPSGDSCLRDRHLALLEGAKEEATRLVRGFYKSEEIFLDMFEDEYRQMQQRPLNVEYLIMDGSTLLKPTDTPLTGVDFKKRLPCGEVERARRAIHVFFCLRAISLDLQAEDELQLPLTRSTELIKIADALDLTNRDLISCTVISKDRQREKRFLVVDMLQLVLVEPDATRMGWGIVKFVGLLQDVEVSGDKEESRSLHVTLHRPATANNANAPPLLVARFQFDDHIRCVAAKQRLSKGRLRARQRKLARVAQVLDLPASTAEPVAQQLYLSTFRPGQVAGRGVAVRVSSASSAARRPERRPRSGAVRVTKPGAPSDVEVAMDASSAQAFAAQNFGGPEEGRRSPSTVSVTSSEDIPLADMSPNHKAPRRSSPMPMERPGRRPHPAAGLRTGLSRSLPPSPSTTARSRDHSHDQPAADMDDSNKARTILTLKAFSARMHRQKRPRKGTGESSVKARGPRGRSMSSRSEPDHRPTDPLAEIEPRDVLAKSLQPASEPIVNLLSTDVTKQTAPILLPPTELPRSATDVTSVVTSDPVTTTDETRQELAKLAINIQDHYSTPNSDPDHVSNPN